MVPTAMAPIEIYGLSRAGRTPTQRRVSIQSRTSIGLAQSSYWFYFLKSCIQIKLLETEKKNFRKLIDILNQWYKTRLGFCLNFCCFFSFIGACIICKIR
jgi:hypothetical protein